jgi:uncharacterized membrane protein
MSLTATGIPRGGGVPRHRLILAILAISLALNVCVIAGVIWNRTTAPETQTGGAWVRKLEASLDLNEQQKAAFTAYIAASRAHNAQLRQDVEPMLEAAWAELAKPQPDQAEVLRHFNDASTRWRASQTETISATLSFLATLNPDQRAKFIAGEREHRASLRRRRVEEAR